MDITIQQQGLQLVTTHHAAFYLYLVCAPQMSQLLFKLRLLFEPGFYMDKHSIHLLPHQNRLLTHFT